MSAATDGPWLRDGRTVYVLETVRGRHGRDETRNRFSFHVQNPLTSDAELEAVAAFAQAAPDLYGALDHPLLRELFGAIEDSGTKEAAHLWGLAVAWFDVRDAALAKARGE